MKLNLAFEKNFSRFTDLAPIGPDGSSAGVRDVRRLGEEKKCITNNREGYIEVICGCMFAGKTEELI